MTADEKLEIKETTSDSVHRFGDGAKVLAIKNVSIPAYIAGSKCLISTDVVACDLPLLLSKESLKKAEAVLNLCKDEATLFGKLVKLEQTSTGHYCINLQKEHQYDEYSFDEQQVLMVIEAKTDKERERMMLKLHRQFGHVSEECKKLLKKAGINDNDLFKSLEKMIKECELCQRFKKTPSRPAVSLPLASDWNEMVYVDLQQLEPSLWFLHIIDVFTRYSGGAIVKTKTGREIVEKFIQHWIGIFAAPKKLMSDNGGEFANEEIIQLGHQFGIEILATAAYSPWSNGICERHNLTLSETVEKVKADRQCSWDTALSWALMAKNSLSNIHGFSAQQLVFGTNPNLPSVISDKLPALEGKTTSRLVGEHMSALFDARKTYTEAECSERI
jgi:hypothetical protein